MIGYDFYDYYNESNIYYEGAPKTKIVNGIEYYDVDKDFKLPNKNGMHGSSNKHIESEKFINTWFKDHPEYANREVYGDYTNKKIINRYLSAPKKLEIYNNYHKEPDKLTETIMQKYVYNAFSTKDRSYSVDRLKNHAHPNGTVRKFDFDGIYVGDHTDMNDSDERRSSERKSDDIISKMAKSKRPSDDVSTDEAQKYADKHGVSIWKARSILGKQKSDARKNDKDYNKVLSIIKNKKDKHNRMEKINDRTNTYRSGIARNNKKDSQISSLKKQRDDALSKVKDLEKELKTAKANAGNSSSSSSSASADIQNSSLRQQIKLKQDLIDRQSSEIRKLNSDKAELQGKLRDANSKISDFNSQISNLQSKINDVKSDASRSENRTTKRLQDKIDEQKDRREIDKKYYQEEIKDLEKDISSLKAERQKVIRERDSYKNDLDDLKIKILETEQKYKRQITKLEEENSELKRSNRRDNTRNESRIREIESELAQAKRDVQKYQNEINMRNKADENRQNRNAALFAGGIAAAGAGALALKAYKNNKAKKAAAAKKKKRWF